MLFVVSPRSAFDRPNAKSKAGPATGSPRIAEAVPAFATPDREIEKKLPVTQASSKGETVTESEANNTVTPNEAAPHDDEPTPKQVRFDSGDRHDGTDSPASSTGSNGSKRGLVSRRGGRYGSPHRGANGAVLEYKTYRSPSKKDDNDTVPSLSSSNSSGLQSSSSPENRKRPLDKSQEIAEKAPEKKVTIKEDTATVSDSSRLTVPQSGAADVVVTSKVGKPTSITCDTSLIASTSPLAPHDTSPSSVERKPGIPEPTGGPKEKQAENFSGRRNVTFSPRPTEATPRKSPTKSPGFQSLPTLHDAKLQSPVGIFLSPYCSSPPGGGIAEAPSFDRQSNDQKSSQEDSKASKSRDQERERVVSTPTDFALDFGKGHELSSSFDASNVLAWLQSPTAHGLFSPGGGLGSTGNTPRKFAAPRTPRTPTVGTSFFFSDVASLPRNGEFASPKAQGEQKRSGSQQGQLSSMICISPLASSKRQGESGQGGSEVSGNTPMRGYKDVFSSPRLSLPRGSPQGGKSPAKGSKGRGRSSLDSVHMVERDLMEDEDLSILLQLASHSHTPGQGGAVFRSPRGRPSNGQQDHRRVYGSSHDNSGGALPGLQLPIIGGQGGPGTKAKLARKTALREPADENDFTPPPLSIRSSSSGGSKEIYLGSGEGERAAGSSSDGAGAKSKAPISQKNAPSKREKAPAKTKKAGKKTASKSNTSNPYPMPGSQMPYPHPGSGDHNVQYYPMPGTMPALPPGGNMRVVVGGPPPNSRAPVSPHTDNYPNSPHRPPPPYTMQTGGPPPPHGSYPRHPYGPPPHHMGGMPVHPYGHYPPPPHHMPMYASQHPHMKNPPKKPKLKGQKTVKRPGDGKTASPPGKKQRRSPSKGGSRRKQKAAGVGEPVDRQKAAAAINAVNQASGCKNDRAAALAAAILRGVTMRPSGKWQAQLYYAGKSRYIGVFDTREKAALAYEIAREKLKADNKTPADQTSQTLKATEAAVNLARKAAFEGVNEKDPRLSSK